MFLCATQLPTIELWVFANRYDLPYYRTLCTRSVPVQMTFMDQYNADGDLQHFLGSKVSDEAIDHMLAAIWDTTTIMMKVQGGNEVDEFSHFLPEVEVS